MLRDIDAVMLAPAATLLARAGLAGTTEPFRLLDQACGSGPLVAQLQRAVDPGVLARSRVRCTDVNEAMLGVLRRRAAAERWVGDVDVAFGNAQVCLLPLPFWRCCSRHACSPTYLYARVHAWTPGG